MKLQHYLGGLEGLPEPLNFEKRVFVEEWEKRIFGIHVAMMGLSNHLGSALPQYPVDEVPRQGLHQRGRTGFAARGIGAGIR
jgi:nitrile hydratase